MLIWSQLLKILCYTPSSLVTYYAMARMLKIKHHWRFMIGMTLLHIITQLMYTFLLEKEVVGADTLKIIVQTGIYFLGALCFTNETFSRRLFAFGTILLAVLGGEIISVAYFSLVGGTVAMHGIADATENTYLFIFMHAITFAVTSVMSLIVLRVWDRVVLKSNNRILGYYVLFPASQALIISMAAYYATAVHYQPSFYAMLAVGIVFCVFADFFLFRSISALSRRAVAEERAAWYEKLLDQQQSYYAQILSDIEDASRIRHDIRNQLQTVYTLMQQGENDAAQQQLDGISNSLERSQQYCANRVVNAVLNVKAVQFSAEGIPFHCRCVVPEELPLAGVELCSLFSNVLDNALNASRSCQGTARSVELTTTIKGGFFILQCRNPYLSDKGHARRRRADGHGLGLEILRDLAAQHNGEFKIEQDGRLFTCTIWLAVPESAYVADQAVSAPANS